MESIQEREDIHSRTKVRSLGKEWEVTFIIMNMSIIITTLVILPYAILMCKYIGRDIENERIATLERKLDKMYNCRV